MRAIGNKKIRVWLALVVASAGMTLTGSSASAAPQSVELCAKAGMFAPLPTTAPGLTVPIWGFGVPTTPGDCSTATASLPGPVLEVNEDGVDTMTISVTNDLPPGHTISFEIPGVTFNAGPTDVAPSDTVLFVFTPSAPGTYLYQSGGDAGRQEAMGLYGAMVVSPGGGQAYDSGTTAFDVDAGPLVLSAVDPNFNADPDGFNMNNYLATYWLINGRAYPDTLPISASSGDEVLLRYVNAGFDNSAMMLLGMHQRVLARDATLLTNPFDADAETIPAGGTEDTIATVPQSDPPVAAGFALYNRNLHVTTGTASDSNYTPGGMLTFLAP
jgi:FtsP/CotA-like multicopper oxidase with cupredoxin domain